MLTYQRNLLKSRINTVIGSLFLASWAFGCGLVVWHTSFDSDPVEHAFVRALSITTELPDY